MQNQFSERILTVLLSILAIGILVYAVFRAIAIPLTHDEALTYSFFVPKSCFDIVFYVKSYGMPNNHILNTLLIKLSTGIFGNSPLAIRLPNLFALAAYLFASYRLVREIPSQWIRMGGFVLLVSNPYIFDFFSLGRGYGIANAFMMISLLLLYRWIKQPDVKKSILILLCAMLMVLANFATVHLFVAIACLIAAFNIKNRVKGQPYSILRSVWIPATSLVLLGGLLYQPFAVILESKQAIGGTEGFWQDCVLSLAYSSLYAAPGTKVIMFSAPYVLVLLIAGIAVVNFFTWKINSWSFLHCISFLIVAFTTLLQFQHLFLGSDFPVTRSIQFLYPLFILVTVFCLENIKQYRLAVNLFLIATAVPAGLHLINSTQTVFVYDWKYDCMNRMVLNDLNVIVAEEHAPLDVKITWIFESGLNYERSFQNCNYVKEFDREGFDRPADYYYVVRDDSNTLALKGKKVIKYYPLTETSLMK